MCEETKRGAALSTPPPRWTLSRDCGRRAIPLTCVDRGTMGSGMKCIFAHEKPSSAVKCPPQEGANAFAQHPAARDGLVNDKLQHPYPDTYAMPQVDSCTPPFVQVAFYLWYGTPAIDGKWLHWDHATLPHWTAKMNEQARLDHLV